jgi:hypothetical protein
MTLAELQAEFLRIVDERTTTTEGATVESADGVWFLCPQCFRANGGPAGTHMVICWRPRVPQSRDPRPGRWEFQGAGLADLSLVAGSSSVQLTSACRAHFFVRGGRVVFC